MEEANEPRRRKRAAWILICVLVFVLYPLSIGPAVVVGLRTGTIGIVAVIYKPLMVIPGPSKQILALYVEWWRELTGTQRN